LIVSRHVALCSRVALVGVVLSATLVAQAPTALAQAAAPMAVSSRVAPAPQPSADAGGWHLEQCMAGLTYGAPLKFAASYGGGLLYESNTGPDVCALGVAKLGFGGAQGSLGIGTSFAPWGTGIMVTGNLVRTFNAPLDATPRRTYAGASVHFWPALALGGEIGYLWRLGDEAGDPGAGKRIVTWSLGFGF